jgi:hypothetical protein
MLKKLALLMAYAKAPRTTIVARHPKQALTAYAVATGLRRSKVARRTVGGLIGVGAAAVVLPMLGWRLIRR